jgi:hypothetical protein
MNWVGEANQPVGVALEVLGQFIHQQFCFGCKVSHHCLLQAIDNHLHSFIYTLLSSSSGRNVLNNSADISY